MRIVAIDDTMKTSVTNKNSLEIVYHLVNKLKLTEEITNESLLMILDEMAEEFTGSSYGYKYLPDFMIEYNDLHKKDAIGKKKKRDSVESKVLKGKYFVLV